MVQVRKSVSNKVGYSVLLEFQIGQHIRDTILMQSFINYLGCGTFYEYKQIVFFRVSKFVDTVDILIPFFIKYPIVGIKYLDFIDFIKIKDLMVNKEHLNLTGLDKIKKIKSGMNRGRT